MRLNIDFAPPSASRSPLRLKIGSVVLVLMLAAAWTLTSETEAGLPPQEVMPNEEDIHSINRAIDDLDFPWLAVLKSLEDSVDESIRLIQFDADARDGRLNLQGEARDGRATLDLPGRLSGHSVISAARLLSQNPAGNDEPREFPLRFALEVSLRASAGGQP